MKAHFLKLFRKHYQKRIKQTPSLDKRFEERYLLFLKDPTNPILKDHVLKGDKLGMRSFSITGDIRVVYNFLENTAYFVDIGTHSQVY